MYMFMIPQLSKHFYPWPCWEVICWKQKLSEYKFGSMIQGILQRKRTHFLSMCITQKCLCLSSVIILWVLGWASMMFFNLYCKLKIYCQMEIFVLFNWVTVQSCKIKIINIFLLAELAMHSACCVSWPHISWCSCHWYNSHALTETGIIQRKLWGMISYEHNLWFLWMAES